MTTGQIANKTGFNCSTVLHHVRGAHSDPPGWFHQQYDLTKKELAKLQRQRRSPTQIADCYGSSVTTVERALCRYRRGGD